MFYLILFLFSSSQSLSSRHTEEHNACLLFYDLLSVTLLFPVHDNNLREATLETKYCKIQTQIIFLNLKRILEPVFPSGSSAVAMHYGYCRFCLEADGSKMKPYL